MYARLSAVVLLSAGLFVPGAWGQEDVSPSLAPSEYVLELDIHPGQRLVRVSGTWQFEEPAGREAAGEVRFQITPHATNLRFGWRQGQLDERPACRPDGGDLACTLTTKSKAVLRRLHFSYDLKAADAPQLRITGQQAFAGGGGELWYPQASYSRRELGEIRCTVPAGWHCFTTGTQLSRQKKGPTTAFASRVSAPAKFAFAAARFLVHDAGRFRLLTLLPRPDTNGRVQEAARALDALERRLGRLPYSRFSLIEIQFGGKVLGTGEFGAIFADTSQFEKPADLSYWAHEFAHQWWGNIVRTRSGTPGQMLMSEGIAQFAALGVIEEVNGADLAARFRKEGLRNSKQSIRGYVELVAEGKDRPLALEAPKGQEQILVMHRLANSKGMMVLWMLSRNLGRKRFDSMLRRFITQHQGELTSWVEFREFISKEAQPTDLAWFFRQWTEQTGLPQLHVDWRQEGNTLKIDVKQCGRVYRLDELPIGISFGKSNTWRLVSLSEERQKFQIPVSQKVATVDLDPERHFLWDTDCRADPQPARPVDP